MVWFQPKALNSYRSAAHRFSVGRIHRIVALLVERIDIGTDGLNVRLRKDGLGGLAREMLAGDMGAAA